MKLVSSASMLPEQQPIRPFLKWAGGKRVLLPVIRAHYPAQHGNYFEPFVGGGAVFLALQPQRGVLNDRNAELVNCYLVVRDHVEALISALNEHTNDPEHYRQVRAWDREEQFAARSPIARAARLIYLNKTCYNGLFRVNAQGQFNVPFGRYAHPNIVDAPALRAVSAYLNRAQITVLNGDFAAACSEAAAGDFLYFDPPYDPVSLTASFTAYDRLPFGKAEQRRLRELVGTLDARGCQFLLSNAYTPFICDLYRDFHCERVAVPRFINSNAQRRGHVDEILVRNYV